MRPACPLSAEISTRYGRCAFPNAGKQKLPLSENAADQNDSVGTENRRQIVKPHRQMLRVGLQNGVRSRAACPRRLENRPAVDDVPRFADLPRQQAVRAARRPPPASSGRARWRRRTAPSSRRGRSGRDGRPSQRSYARTRRRGPPYRDGFSRRCECRRRCPCRP